MKKKIKRAAELNECTAEIAPTVHFFVKKVGKMFA